MNNTKPIIVEKYLTKNSLKEDLIGRWFKPKGYELSLTSINLESLHITVNLVFGKYDEFKKFIKDKHDFDTKFKQCVAMVVQLDDNGISWSYMLIQENNWTADNYNTIVHELHHLTHFSLEEKGIEYGRGGEELFAYVQGFYMEMVVRAFLELNKVTKGKK